MRDRRFTPLSGRTRKANGPSQLANLQGDRKPGAGHRRETVPSKPPKLRFAVGQQFEYDQSIWEIIYIYRLANEPGIWYHCLEERKGAKISEIGARIIDLGAGATTPKVVYEAFASYSDATAYFIDLYAHGDQITKSTQELLQLKRVR